MFWLGVISTLIVGGGLGYAWHKRVLIEALTQARADKFVAELKAKL